MGITLYSPIQHNTAWYGQLKEIKPLRLRARHLPTRTEKRPGIDQYQEYVCEMLGVPFFKNMEGVHHHVGDFDMTSSPIAIDAVVHIYQLQTEELLFNYDEYLDGLKRLASIKRDYKHGTFEDHKRWSGDNLSDSEIKDIILKDIHSISLHKPNKEGYVEYIKLVAPTLYREIIQTPIPLHLEENPDKPHGYILGTPGSGKSELLKLLIHTYVTNPRYGAVVVIDPTSDFVSQIAKWKEFNAAQRERLVYVRPTLVSGMSPVINPFEIDGVKATDYSEKALNVKRVVAQELVEALGRIISEGGSYLTGPMRTILTNCVLVLLDKPNATLKDLSNFMKTDKSEALFQFACRLSHHEYLADYFQSEVGGFKTKSNGTTKEAIGRRLDELLSVGTFSRLTCGKNTINLVEAVNQKKVILFDLGKGAIGKKEGSAFGRLIIAMLMGMAYRRENLKKEDRIPCSVIVDECHNFVSESMEDILTEARKYRLFITLAQQIAGQRMPITLRDVVLETTNLQAVGGTSASGAKRNADIVGVDAEEIRKLRIGEFYVRASRAGSPMKFRTRTDLLDYRNCVHKLTWRAIQKEQIRKYYQPYDKKIKPIIEEEVDISPVAWD